MQRERQTDRQRETQRERETDRQRETHRVRQRRKKGPNFAIQSEPGKGRKSIQFQTSWENRKQRRPRGKITGGEDEGDENDLA